MDKEAHDSTETMLLIDAAGPLSIVGLVKDSEWIACETSHDDFLEVMQGKVDRVMRENQLGFKDLCGIYYAAGPGSTLGLRLAALFIRTLLKIPDLQGLRCYQYHNLEVAVSASSCGSGVAPWRRDKFHLCEMDDSGNRFNHAEISTHAAAEAGIPGYLLGKRKPPKDIRIDWQPYPANALPLILRRNPSLLRETLEPLPYSAAPPEFRKWNPQRHAAK